MRSPIKIFRTIHTLEILYPKQKHLRSYNHAVRPLPIKKISPKRNVMPLLYIIPTPLNLEYHDHPFFLNFRTIRYINLKKKKKLRRVLSKSRWHVPQRRRCYTAGSLNPRDTVAAAADMREP